MNRSYKTWHIYTLLSALKVHICPQFDPETVAEAMPSFHVMLQAFNSLESNGQGKIKVAPNMNRENQLTSSVSKRKASLSVISAEIHIRENHAHLQKP